jgi:6-phosphofructokinase
VARKNAFYAQSGGVTAVINASACGVLQTAREHSGKIGKVYAGRNGIIGALTEDLIDTSVESEAAIAALKHTPGAAFGSCRYKLTSAKLGCRCHWAVPDYLQRSARHIASETDVEQAYAVGRAAVEFAIAGKSAVMPAIRRLSDAPYRWDIIEAPLSEVANQEKMLPPNFISADGFGITEAARRYLAPLIVGEVYPPFKDGLPDYVKLQNAAVPKKLSVEFAV